MHHREGAFRDVSHALVQDQQTRQRRAEPKQRTKAAADAVRLARLRDIGRAIAKKFARDGAASIGVDYGNHAAAARDAVSRIKALGAEVVALQAELTGERRVQTSCGAPLRRPRRKTLEAWS
jgi:hypothetical protein